MNSEEKELVGKFRARSLAILSAHKTYSEDKFRQLVIWCLKSLLDKLDEIQDAARRTSSMEMRIEIPVNDAFLKSCEQKVLDRLNYLIKA